MKKSLLLLAFAAIGLSASAQDLIVLKDASEIQAKVTTISATEIGYKKWSNPDGPSYTIAKNNVLFIKYQNGEKEVFNSATAPAPTATVFTTTENPRATAIAVNNPRAGKVTFQGYFHGIALANGSFAGPAFDLSLGARIFDYAYVGAELGFDYLFVTEKGYSGSVWTVPVGVNFRGYVPTNGRVYPFGSFSLGAAVADGAAFHCQLLTGVDVGKFTIGLGWDRIGELNSFVFKIGVRFGK